MNRKQLKRIIAAQVSEEEMDAAHSWVYNPKENERSFSVYYPELFVETCQKKLRGEISKDYFRSWLIVLCVLLMRQKEHYDLGYLFDGMAFWDLDDRACRMLISDIRQHDTRLKHSDVVRYHCRKKMKVTYLRDEFVDHTRQEIVYKCYIVDHAAKRYDVRMVDESEVDYDLEKNFFEMYDEEKIRKIREQEANGSEEPIDMTIPERQFCDTEEELHSLFFTRKYVRDKTLQI